MDAYELGVSLGVSACVLPPEVDGEIEQWRAELFWRPDGLESERRVAVADFLVVPDDVAQPALALEAMSSDAAPFADLFDGAELDESLDAEGFVGVVIVDRVEVDSALRRNGLGPLLVAEALQRLGRGCAMAACSDSPTGGSASSEVERNEIRLMIRDFGFSEWRDSIWTLDLATTGLSATRTAIRETRLRPAN